jgi:hypothetical protein
MGAYSIYRCFFAACHIKEDEGPGMLKEIVSVVEAFESGSKHSLSVNSTNGLMSTVLISYASELS